MREQGQDSGHSATSMSRRHTGARPTVRPASAADVERLRDTLAEAFHDDPVFGWLLPDEDSRPELLRRFFELELREHALVRGHVFTSAELQGASLSMPPGAWRAPAAVAARQGAVFGARLPQAAELSALMERHHPREPHHYFPYIGVAPAAQGHGLGSSLMRPTLEHCDREGAPAYLEATSERNAALYRRLGFEPRGELRLAGGPPLYPMWRPPRANARGTGVHVCRTAARATS